MCVCVFPVTFHTHADDCVVWITYCSCTPQIDCRVRSTIRACACVPCSFSCSLLCDRLLFCIMRVAGLLINCGPKLQAFMCMIVVLTILYCIYITLCSLHFTFYTCVVGAYYCCSHSLSVDTVAYSDMTFLPMQFIHCSTQHTTRWYVVYCMIRCISLSCVPHNALTVHCLWVQCVCVCVCMYMY